MTFIDIDKLFFLNGLAQLPEYNFAVYWKGAMFEVFPQFVIAMLKLGVIIFIVTFLISVIYELATDKKRAEEYNKRVAQYKKSIGK
jgi:uncharacterized membrane protein (DUF106 family)